MPTTAPHRQIVLNDIFTISKRPELLEWEFFREGIKIHRLYGDAAAGPSAALLWYDAGAGVPRHEHLGYEHILILSNSQSDDSGENLAGTFIVNPPGSMHAVNVKGGGMALLIWERPVRFHDPGE